MKVDVNELKKRFQVRAVLGITVESGRVVVEVVRREGESQTFTLPLGAEAVLAEPEQAGKALASLLESNAIRERRAVVCIPASWALTTSAEVPEVADDDLRGFLELRAEREFPIAVSELRLAHCAYTLPDGKRSATLAAVPAKRLEAVERMLATANCKAVSISLGLNACLPEGRSPAALHFLANGNHVDVIIAAGGGIAALRSLPGPAGPDAPTFDARTFTREVRITLGRLPEPMRAQVREARFSGAPASAANLCGEIREDLQRLGIESRLDPATGEDHPAAAREAAEHHLQQHPVIFEFLPPQIHRWQTLVHRFDSKRRRWLVLAALALIVLPIATFLVRSRIESGLAAEWAGMRRNVSDLEALQQRIRQFRPWFEPAPVSVQILESIASAFPEDGEVWAKSITLGEGGKVTCSGLAKNQNALKTLLDELRKRPDVSGLQRQQVRGENPVQFSITFKWEAHDGR